MSLPTTTAAAALTGVISARRHSADRTRDAEIDRLRQTAVDSVNAILRDLGQPELRGIR